MRDVKSTCCATSGMAEGSSTRGMFRQKAIATATLLLEAAERLDNSSLISVDRETSGDIDRSLQNLGRQASGGPSGRTPIVYSSSQRERERQPSGSQRASNSRSTQSSLSVGAGELRGLFNWSTRSAVGTKRKGSRYTPKSKKKRVLTWTHTYVCLAECDDSVVPDTHYRASLKLAGLGEKRFAVDIYCTGQEFYDELLYQYPKLREGGGYELLRVPEGGGKDLDVIRVPEGGYNTEYLRAVVHSAKIFIRPLQKALDLTPANHDESATPPAEEICLKCGSIVSLAALKQHIAICQSGQTQNSGLGNQEGERQPSGSNDSQWQRAPQLEQQPPRREVNQQQLGSDHHQVPSLDGNLQQPPRPGRDLHSTRPDNINQQQPLRSDGDHHQPRNPILVPDSPEPHFDSDDDTMLQYGIYISKHSREVNAEPGSIAEIVKTLSSSVSEGKCSMVVRRGHVLEDALKRVGKASFDPSMSVEVEFVGEVGADTGGLTREFFRLFAKAMARTYLEATGCFKHNAVALQADVYHQLGQLVAMSLAMGGSGVHIFSQSVFSYLSGTAVSTIIVDICEVPDVDVKEMLEKISSATDSNSLREIAMEHCTTISSCGFTKPLPLLTTEDKIELVQAVALHYVLLQCKAEMDQFCEGLMTLGVLDTIKKHPKLLCPFFTREGIQHLTPDVLRKLFVDIRFSERGSNARDVEEKTYMLFLEYLDDCEQALSNDGRTDYQGENEAEENISAVTLSMVLAFFTGAEEVPPLGFPHDPVLTFSNNPYPTASTCAIQLTLPTVYSEYPAFKAALNLAFISHGGFGLS